MDFRYNKYVKRDVHKRSAPYLIYRSTQYVSTPWMSGTTNMSKETYARDPLNILFIVLRNMSRPHGFQVRQTCQKRRMQEIYWIAYLQFYSMCLDPMDLMYDKSVKRDLRKRFTQYLIDSSTQYVSTPWMSGTTNMSKETYARDLCQKIPTQEIHSISYW